MTINDVLTLVGSRIEEEKAVTVSTRYTRAQSLGELGDEPAYYIEPGGVEMERRNVGCARETYRVRAVSTEYVTDADYEERAQTRAQFWADVAYNLVSHPMLGDRVDNAFVMSTTTFPDAPAGYSAEALGNGVTVLSAGIEVTVVVD